MKKKVNVLWIFIKEPFLQIYKPLPMTFSSERSKLFESAILKNTQIHCSCISSYIKSVDVFSYNAYYIQLNQAISNCILPGKLLIQSRFHPFCYWNMFSNICDCSKKLLFYFTALLILAWICMWIKLIGAYFIATWYGRRVAARGARGTIAPSMNSCIKKGRLVWN